MRSCLFTATACHRFAAYKRYGNIVFASRQPSFCQNDAKTCTRSDRSPQQGAKTQSLHATRETTMPAVLAETGFRSPGGNIERMIDGNWQDKVAAPIAAGIAEYHGLSVN
ncbi:N-acetylmuramoyl-L-alanine amidase [Saccharibacillus deserti]|uniref:N-acetylmuramoyl-L-alanine amidase n=1 Tax=Saccharibacillus deserti TaxID=1634444 RepID=UPI0020A67721|nr:N-acetylmuramoyl-L-alanine amidase [Saccharibacillus deserti]